jgi:hypothetical protein
MASPQDFIQNKVNEFKTENAKHTITIKDKVYKVEPLDAESGLDTWEFLMNKLLPSIGTGLDSFRHDPIMDGAPTTFSEAMLHLSAQLSKDPGTLKALSLTLLEGLTVDGELVDFKEHFSANYGTWLKVVKFALTENFSSFFEEGWESAAKDLMGMVAPVMSQSEDTQD